jgi:succinate-semialdehyde dehydrogenase/glutarate-semialdehyde dehydrogenase
VALAVKAAGGAKFRNAGQVCISPTRFLVHESIQNEFAAALVKYTQGLKVGDGSAEGTTMGPLANPRRLTAMAEFTQDALKAGATVAAGGARIGDVGNFWQPTMLTDVPLSAKVFNDEPFGPMAAIRPFNTLDEAIAEANRLPFGLAGYAFTKSLKNADLLARKVEVGMLWVNMPAAAFGRDALWRHQGLRLRLGRRPRGDGRLPERTLRGDHERLSGGTRAGAPRRALSPA